MFVKPDKNLMSRNGCVSADTSSIIYLARIEMLDQYCKFKKIIISEQIYNELMIRKCSEISKHKYLFSNKRLEVLKTDNTSVTLEPDSLTLKYVDSTIITLYKIIKAQGVLSDDGKICSYCKASAIPFFNTPMALFSMAVDGILSYNVFVEKLDEVYKIGRFSEKICSYMENLIESHFNNV